MKIHFGFACLMTIVFMSQADSICSSSWEKLTSVFEVHSNLDCDVIVAVRRKTEFCLNDFHLFRTTRLLIWMQDAICFDDTGFGSCENDCSSITVNVALNCLYLNESRTCNFDYVNRNCDVMHWGSWEKVSSCSGSNLSENFTRSCYDCDRKTIDGKHCFGSSTKQHVCQFSWSSWGEWSLCDTNYTETRSRTRKCRNENDEEVSDVTACGEHASTQVELCGSQNDFISTPFITDTVNLASANSSLTLFLAITIPAALLFIFVSMVLIVLLKYKKSNIKTRFEHGTPKHRNIVGPVNGDVYSSVVKRPNTTDTVQIAV